MKFCITEFHYKLNTTQRFTYVPKPKMKLEDLQEPGFELSDEDLEEMRRFMEDVMNDAEDEDE
jgi:hypothetical protein